MKFLTGTVSFDHEEYTIILDAEPELEDRIKVPLFGDGIVTGLNSNYKGTDETWVMVQRPDGKTMQFRYVLRAKDDQG